MIFPILPLPLPPTFFFTSTQRLHPHWIPAKDIDMLPLPHPTAMMFNIYFHFKIFYIFLLSNKNCMKQICIHLYNLSIGDLVWWELSFIFHKNFTINITTLNKHYTKEQLKLSQCFVSPLWLYFTFNWCWWRRCWWCSSRRFAAKGCMPWRIGSITGLSVEEYNTEVMIFLRGIHIILLLKLLSYVIIEIDGHRERPTNRRTIITEMNGTGNH